MNALLQRLTAPFANPVLRRELRLITRRGHFEWVVLVLTVGMTLAIASVGGRANAGVHPAFIGKMLFQTFFGLAHGLVLVAGPAVAASSIAAEREGHTYEALALTGLGPGQIARGKFLAAFTNVGAYVIALAPVGALPFLFGGVSALSMVFAFGMLFVFTALAALVGLAISARLPSTRSALITSVIAGVALALIMHGVFGETLGDTLCAGAGMERPGTIWLPVLLAEGNLGGAATAMLIIGPLVVAALTGWFLLEVCSANLSDPTADRSSGLKRWFVASVFAGCALSVAPVIAASTTTERAMVAVNVIAGYAVFAMMCALVFQGDPIIAPRRVRLQWQLRGAGVLRRFFGPGATASAAMQLLAAAFALAVLSVAGLALSLADSYGSSTAPLGIVAMALPVATFILFVVGLATWSRVRWGAAVGRVIVALTLLLLVVAPFALTAILVAGTDAGETALPLLAAPSPAFALSVARKVALDQTDVREVVAVLVCAVFYALFGLIALVLASVRADRLISALDADAARMDAVIASEDAAPRVSRVPSPTAAVEPAASAEPATAVPSIIADDKNTGS